MQSTDQRKFQEEPAIESVVSALVGQMINTIEQNERKVNEENTEKNPSNRRGQEKRRHCFI